ncbi:MAG: hypothetical protein GX367_07480 [Bacteroidales bacterium]|nr:hypothetical protein [Bacteroidales bacterium]
MTGEESGVILLKQEIKDRVEQIREGVVPDGYKETRVGIIPEDWEVTKLGHIVDILNGTSPSKVIFDEASDIPYFKVDDLNNSEKWLEESELTVSSERIRLLPKNSLIFPKRGAAISTNKVRINRRACHLDTNLMGLTLKEDNFEYFYNYIYNKRLYRIADVSTIPQINNKHINELDIKVPTIPEQQKIADILSTWDRAIELKESLIKEKEEQKKGLMQELLTPVNSNQWFKLKLRDLGKTYNGLTGKTRKDFGTGKKFITFKNIFDNSKLNLNVFDRVLLKEGEKQNMIKYGDVFFTTSSETPHEVGMSSVLLDEIEEDIYLNSFCFGFRLNSFEEVLPEFLRYCLRGDSFRYEMMRLAQGSTRFNLSKTEFLKTTLEVPSISQQHRIAKILSTADQEIDLLKREVAKLKEQKKGLMQLLLTGIVRVKEAVTSG